MLATLTPTDGDVYCISCLDRARLLKIDSGRLLLTGAEIVPRGRSMKSQAEAAIRKHGGAFRS